MVDNLPPQARGWTATPSTLKSPRGPENAFSRLKFYRHWRVDTCYSGSHTLTGRSGPGCGRHISRLRVDTAPRCRCLLDHFPPLFTTRIRLRRASRARSSPSVVHLWNVAKRRLRLDSKFPPQARGWTLLPELGAARVVVRQARHGGRQVNNLDLFLYQGERIYKAVLGGISARTVRLLTIHRAGKKT